MRPQALNPTLTESSLRQALEGDGFTVEYRPVLDLRSSTVAGVEALVRWDHPRRGRLDPEEFLPLAEETGLIHSIGAFMLDAACRQTVQWAADSPDQPALTTWLRIFTSQLLQPELPGMARATLSRTGVDPGAVCLVIDESVLADQSRSTANSLLALKGLGMRLAVAGFGAGRSSVADLRRFPLDQLTLDPSLIQGFGRRADDSALVAAMTSMAAALGLTVMAAGVETEDQLTELGALRCDLAQGPHIAGPEPADVLYEMVRGDRRLCPAGAPSRV
jgi:EAL domain-containing protein (putative c-di-GMP-specific phosphodiesterase class I)